ncbi:MAG: ABC transporter ATP-binding protein [Acidobacteria bacterium]|nr:ABC transporter ATP-binding protein [Acidobacteriota bacterium]
MKNSSAIRVDRVTKCYGNVVAAEDVSLEVERGEFLTLLGPSGSGKTTLLRLIAGFDRPDAGRVYLSGQDVTDEPPYRRRIHTVFQQYVLFPHLSVFKNIAFGLEQKTLSKREIERKVGQALELVRLSGYEQRMPHELSGGEQQRVAVARAIVLEPEALLLDEPLAALDFKLRKEMQLELKRLQRQLNISFLLVTHDQEEAMTMSDRIAVMAAGRIQQVGTPQEVYENPETAFIANFIGISNIFEAEVIARNGHQALLELYGQRIEIPMSGKPLAGPRVRFAVRPEKIDLRSQPLNHSGWIQLEGVIEDKVYLGDLTHWQVRVNDSLVTVSEQNGFPLQAEHFRSGQRVFLGWPRESIVFLSS